MLTTADLQVLSMLAQFSVTESVQHCLSSLFLQIASLSEHWPGSSRQFIQQNALLVSHSVLFSSVHWSVRGRAGGRDSDTDDTGHRADDVDDDDDDLPRKYSENC